MPLPPFQQLLDQYGVDVHRLLIASVGSVDADDCYQETWIAALRAYPRLHDPSNLRGWLLTIAHRKAIDHVRRRARIAVPVGASVELAAEAQQRQQPDDSPWDAVAQLPPKQRMAVALRFALDLDYEQIAQAMATTAPAARRSVHEGLKKLRQELNR